MSSAQLEWFISWVPLVAGSLGAMTGGFLSDRLAQVTILLVHTNTYRSSSGKEEHLFLFHFEL